MRTTRWATTTIAGLTLAGVTSITGAGAAFATTSQSAPYAGTPGVVSTTSSIGPDSDGDSTGYGGYYGRDYQNYNGYFDLDAEYDAWLEQDYDFNDYNGRTAANAPFNTPVPGSVVGPLTR